MKGTCEMTGGGKQGNNSMKKGEGRGAIQCAIMEMLETETRLGSHVNMKH